MASGTEPQPIGIHDYSSSVTPSGTYYNAITLKKSGDVKQLHLVIILSNTIVPAGSYTKIATIPSDCRPNNDVNSTFTNQDGHIFSLQITSGGNINIYNAVANNAINGQYVFTYI